MTDLHDEKLSSDGSPATDCSLVPWYGNGYRLLDDGEMIENGDEYLVTRWPEPVWTPHKHCRVFRAGIICATRRKNPATLDA